MKLRKGQATRASLLVLHQFGHIAMLAMLIVLVLFGLFGFRLSRGPIAIPHLASWFATHFTGEGVVVHIDEAELAWAGYHKGGAVPFVLRLADLEVRTDSGSRLAYVPAAILSLPVVDLFGGRQPVTLEGEGATFPDSDVPVSWYAKLWPGAGFTLSHSDVHVKIGTGHIGKKPDSIALSHAYFTLSVLHDGEVRLTNGQAQLAPYGASAPTLAFSFSGRYDHHWQGLLSVKVDKVQARDLPLIWPPQLLPATRQWIATHITAGSAQNADFTFNLAAQGDLSHLQIKNIQGGFQINGLSVVWLEGAPPLTDMNGQFSMRTADTGIITATSGDVAGIRVENGSLALTGLTAENQAGLLKMSLAGPVQTILPVLAAPPLNLLGHVPAEVEKATGNAQANLMVHIPFEDNLTESDITLQMQAVLTDLRVPTPLAGVAYTKGRMVIISNGHQLSATAQADFGGLPANLTMKQDLSSPNGDTQLTMTGEAGPLLWQALGFNTPYTTLQGNAPFTFTVSGPTDSEQQAALTLNLTPTRLLLPALGWSKSPGQPAKLEASLSLRGQQLVALQSVEIQAPHLTILGRGTGNRFSLEQVKIGRSQMSGTLIRPSKPGTAWILRISGATLDLRLKALTSSNLPTNTPNDAFATKFPWQADLTFAAVYTAPPPAPSLLAVNLQAAGNGSTLTTATASAQGVSAVVTPQPDGQHRLFLQGDDAGKLLDILGVYSGIRGGTLNLSAIYGNGPVQGVLKLDDIRLLHAPGFVKILQAATLYGIAEAASGPGLLLNHTVIPFTLNQTLLTLHGADSYSEALGFTADGTINISHNTCDLETTIIPAYALNSFLGKIPLIGHLFTAEKGGGLFAMRAHVQGPLNDPDVSVNPLSVLTPGFLRGIFGLAEK